MATGLSLIMATRNESRCIEKIVREVASVLSKIPLETELVVADFSEDDTLDVAMATAESCLMKAVPLGVNRSGRGYALRVGVEKASYDLICLLDGDGNHDPRYIPRLLEAHKPGCIAMASRFPPLGWSEEHTFFHYYGNRIAVATVNLLFRANVSDITNGFYVMNKEVWDRLDLDSDYWSFDAQVVCRALKREVGIIEIPYLEPKRKGGRAHLNLIEAFWRIGGRVFFERVTP